MEIKGYSDLWKSIIRPPRDDEYSDSSLGEKLFSIRGRQYQRTDVPIINERGLKLECTHYEPIENQRPWDQLPCVLYLHGNASSRTEGLLAVKVLLPNNITVMTLDFSGSGKSEGEYISLGFYERDDVKAVVDYLRNSGRTSTVGLWGRSMGAVTALMHSDRDPSIAGIVCDSPFSDLKKLATELGKKYSKMPGFVLSIGMKFIAGKVKKEAKFDLEKVSPIKHVDEAFIPALFGHATDDDFILPSHSEDLYERYSGEKDYITFEGDHNSYRPQFFLDKVVIFFLNSLRVQEIVPQDKVINSDYNHNYPELEVFGDNSEYYDPNDFNQDINPGTAEDVTEDDLMKMAMEMSLQSYAEEAKANPEEQENEYLAQAFSLNDK